MEFGALGPIGATGGDGPLGLSDLERVVLGALLLYSGTVVPAATIADAVWNGAEPPSARKSLQMHVVRLRQKLGADVIETADGGYRLVAERNVIDVCRFADDPRAHLDLWRGRPFEELGEWPPAVAARATLDRLRADAQDADADARVEAGTATVAELEALVRDAPDREHRWVLLMRVLYRAGQQADALQAFARARTVLREGYGLEPGPELAALERAILDHDPQLLATDDHLRRARALRAHGQPTEALVAFEAALELADRAGVDPRVAIDIACELAECARAVGLPDRAREVLHTAGERARLVEDTHRLVAVALATTGDGWLSTLDPNASAITMLDEAVKVLGDGPTPLRARVLARRAISESHSSAGAAEDAATALALARVLRDPETTAAALLASLVVDQDLATLDVRQRRAVELLTLAAANDAPRWQAWALPHLARVAAHRGDVATALAHLDELAHLAVTEDDPVAGYYAAAGSVLRATLAGDFERSCTAADDVRDAALRAFMEPTAAAMGHFGTIGMLRLLNARFDEVAPLPDITFPLPTMHATYVTSRALREAGLGDDDGARAVLAAVEPARLAALSHDMYWPSLMWMQAALARTLGDTERAAAVIEQLQPFATLHIVDGAGIYHGAIAHHLGVACVAAGDLDAAHDAFAAAVAAHQATGAPTWVTRSEQELAAIRR